jgi:hypothetical protein
MKIECRDWYNVHIRNFYMVDIYENFYFGSIRELFLPLRLDAILNYFYKARFQI